MFPQSLRCLPGWEGPGSVREVVPRGGRRHDRVVEEGGEGDTRTRVKWEEGLVLSSTEQGLVFGRFRGPIVVLVQSEGSGIQDGTDGETWITRCIEETFPRGVGRRGWEVEPYGSRGRIPIQRGR